MNCHGNNKENQGSHKHNPMKHMIHMVICCGLPMLIITFLPVIAKFSPAAGIVLAGIAPFICPIMMFLMIPMMLGGKKQGNCCENSNSTEPENHELGQRIE